jgi:chemotaxis signal transduction protein
MSDRASQLRAAFDRGFAEAPRGPRAETIDLLRIQVGGDLYAIAMMDVASVHVDRHVCPVPSPARALLGVIAVRSAIVPLYDLQAILETAARSTPRWCAVAREAPAGFAFHGFDGLMRIAAGAIRSEQRGFTRGVVSDGGRSYPVINLAAVTSSLLERPVKER